MFLLADDVQCVLEEVQPAHVLETAHDQFASVAVVRHALDAVEVRVGPVHVLIDVVQRQERRTHDLLVAHEDRTLRAVE